MLDKSYIFEQFYKESYKSFFLQAYHIVDDEEVCRDIVSECYEYAWAHYDNLSSQNMTSYLRNMLKNKCIDHVRKEKVKARYVDYYKRMSESSIDENTDDRVAAIYEVVERLKPPTSVILEEVFFNRKRYKEVAEEMNISASTVKKHIIKALKEIRFAVKRRDTQNIRVN